MKRLLPYVILALVFHAVILSIDFGWLNLNADLSPVAKSLSITLSANRPQKTRAQAAAPNKLPEKLLDPGFRQRPKENLNAMPTPARVKQTNQFQNPLPAIPPKPVVNEARLKKSLKASTYRKQQIKAIEAFQAAPGPEARVPRKAETQVFSTASAEPESVRQPLPADSAFIKKTHQVPQGVSAPTTAAAIPPEARSDDTLSGSILEIARPLYRLNTPPPYPRKARRLGYEGIVMLKVLIDETGRVDDLKLLESSGHGILDRAALLAVEKWRFEPGSEGGLKKKMWVKIPIRFQLE